MLNIGRFFNKRRKAKCEYRSKLKQLPFSYQRRSISPNFSIHRVYTEVTPAQEAKRRLLAGIVETDFTLWRKILLQALKQPGISWTELRDYMIPASLQEIEQEVLELGMLRLGRVKIRENSVAAGEICGGHESTSEKIFLFDLSYIEKNRKALPIKQNDHVWIGSYERTRRHIGPEHRWLVLLSSRFEVLFFPLIVKIIKSIFDGSDKREAIIAGDFAKREFGRFNWGNRRRWGSNRWFIRNRGFDWQDKGSSRGGLRWASERLELRLEVRRREGWGSHEDGGEVEADGAALQRYWRYNWEILVMGIKGRKLKNVVSEWRGWGSMIIYGGGEHCPSKSFFCSDTESWKTCIIFVFFSKKLRLEKKHTVIDIKKNKKKNYNLNTKYYCY